MGEIDMSQVTSRIADGYAKEIACGEGWWPLIKKLDLELADIDPMYVIYQVKEKFGGLRFYFAPSEPNRSATMTAIIKKYEQIAACTCEVTGNPGSLMVRKGGGRILKTLSPSVAGDDWQRFDSGAELNP